MNEAIKASLPAISPPPSSSGGVHDSVHLSANTSLVLTSRGGVGLSAGVEINGLYYFIEFIEPCDQCYIRQVDFLCII